MEKLRVLDLFSGLGGFSLGLERTGGFETIAFCEIEDYPRRVLKKHWPDVPIHEDIRKLDGTEYNGTVDLISGGYPCQPYSHSGKRTGQEDDRELWPEMFRIIKAVRPRWVIAENVYGHISLGLDGVLSNLEAENYTCWLFVIPACAVDAKHRRDRVWIIAHTNSINGNGSRHDSGAVFREQSEAAQLSRSESTLANTNGGGKPQQEGRQQEISRRPFDGGEAIPDNGCGGSERERRSQRRCQEPSWWELEPDVGRVANGIPARMDRLKCLGNAVVPQILTVIGHMILEVDHAN